MTSATTKKPIKCAINGVLLLDKPSGISSNAALQIAKRLLCAKKAGHTGSLDPLASGMLPLCFGEATKFSQYLLEADKKYWVMAKLGVRTTTSDSEGEVISQNPVPSLTPAQMDQAFDTFRGEIDQVPSMYSALKHKGQPLYKLARQGVEVERKSRRITIHELKVLDIKADTVTFEVHCTKGTYVRTIVDDFGEQLGCGAHVIGLRRLSVGHYAESQMIPLAALEKEVAENDSGLLTRHLLPLESSVMSWPAVKLVDATLYYLRQGQSVMTPNAPAEGWVRLLDQQECFVGVGEVLESGKIAPRRLVNRG